MLGTETRPASYFRGDLRNVEHDVRGSAGDRLQHRCALASTAELIDSSIKPNRQQHAVFCYRQGGRGPGRTAVSTQDAPFLTLTLIAPSLRNRIQGASQTSRTRVPPRRARFTRFRLISRTNCHSSRTELRNTTDTIYNTSLMTDSVSRYGSLPLSNWEW